MIFFTSDTHFGHTNIIKYCNRPFSNAHEMDKILIRNWNLRVSEKDTIYHLGDFGSGPSRFLIGIVEQLKGKKFFITGSHDHSLEKRVAGVEFVGPLFTVKGIRGIPEITLCHYSMRVWPKSHYGTWHLFGHSHGKLPPLGKSFDVGVDNHNFYPWSLDEIEEKMTYLGKD